MSKWSSALVVAACVASAAGPACAERINEADAAPNIAAERSIERHMAEAGIVGLGAAIIIGDRVVWSRGFGFADKAARTPFTPDTVMGVASVTKTILGAAMMRAVEDGKVSLDGDVAAHLPFAIANPHRPGAAITLRQLATHTSGIVDRPPVYSETYVFGGSRPEPLDRFLQSYLAVGGARHAPENFLKGAHGALREYSNIGAALAGLVIERAVGETLDSYARRHIFAPLGMDSTSWSVESKKPAGGRSALYASHAGAIVPIPAYASVTYPDGGVRTSVNDLSRFFVALLNDGRWMDRPILSPASVREMRRLQFDDSNRPENFPESEGNSGLFWRTKRNGEWLGHGGSDPGVAAEMLTDRTGRIGVIVFSNTSLSGDDGVAFLAILEEVWRLARRFDAEEQSGRGPR